MTSCQETAWGPSILATEPGEQMRLDVLTHRARGGRGHTAPVYADDDAAALYDLLNPWDASDDFYLSHVLAA